jgi:hypothetical protein
MKQWATFFCFLKSKVAFSILAKIEKTERQSQKKVSTLAILHDFILLDDDSSKPFPTGLNSEGKFNDHWQYGHLSGAQW